MVTTNDIARHVWQDTTSYVMHPKPLAISSRGVYAFRLSKGCDIFGKTSYMVEVLTLLRLQDRFCDENTQKFSSLIGALKHLYKIQQEALDHYREIDRRIADEG